MDKSFGIIICVEHIGAHHPRAVGARAQCMYTWMQSYTSSLSAPSPPRANRCRQPLIAKSHRVHGRARAHQTYLKQFAPIASDGNNSIYVRILYTTDGEFPRQGVSAIISAWCAKARNGQRTRVCAPAINGGRSEKLHKTGDDAPRTQLLYDDNCNNINHSTSVR